ncbi:homeobox protein 5 isoform X2 [Zeugodacus cucurbitae]|uniref:homeobox protein 5 isoform X2 n=1 Tax=Zeugodacus cucurbitae TaxID=28588 RepID=UPI0023D927CF|nr:homeobox protein 5 isoform X2 [Zeugodacus cucurbitae]
MSKKMWSKIFKTSKTTKVAKLTTASSANKRCSIYEEYQQLNGGKVEGTKKQKKLAKGVEQQSKQAQEQEAQQQQQQQQKQDELQSTAGDVASATEASTHHKNAERNAQMTATTTATTMSINKNSEVTQTLGISDVTLASSSNTTTSNSNNSKPPADANDQLIANKNSNNNNKQQSTFAKVVSSFTLKRNNNTASAQKQQQPQQQQLQPTTKGNGNVKAAGKLPKNNSNTIASTADPYPDAPAQLVPCPICQRTFNPVPLQKHVGICEKMATKKRNVFDSSRQRREGTELASYPLPKNFGLPPTKQEARGQSPKPLQHIASPILTRKKSSGGEELARSTARASMRKLAANAQSKSPCTTVAASAVAAAATASQAVNNSNNISQMTTSTASTTSLPGAGSFTRDRMRSSDRSLAKRIQPPPAEQCPHCERCFGPKAYDRHVEWCKEKALQASIKQTTKTEQNLAKERLEARTKYRAPCLKTKRSINRDKYAGLAGDENEFGDSVKQTANGSHNSNNTNNNSSLTNGIGGNDNSNNINSSANGNGNGNGVMSLSMTSSMTSESGLTCDKYDPFLSAKRQLEELCSSSPPNNPSFSTNLPKTTPQTPVSPAGLPAKMSTSLTLSSSTPNSSPLTNNAQNLRQTATPTVNATKTTSNFRRTSSLRGPRRSPMLSSRPLFAQNHRPTIQRGLSDEGPISTNFLKPEEYDEMPVRSVCVNDYAVTKSPRVARRDNSLSNRKQCLKLNVQGAGATMTSVTNTPNRATMLGVNSSDELMNSAAKYLSKTDSLAAFLKYEKELEKLNAQAAADASASLYKPNEQNANDTSATNLHSHIISKELKEKSNTLSKQNSAKSIKAELNESPKPNTDSVQENLFQHLPTPVPKTPHGDTSPYDRGNVSIQKTQAVRLEAIALPQATSTPIAKPSTTRALTQATPTQLPVVSRAINLNTLLGESRPTTTSSLSAYSKDVKSSSSNEYIDPKLINKCDNLPVNLNSVRTLKSVGANNVERRLDFSSSSSECSATQAGPISQLTKLLPLTKPTEVLHVTAPVVVTTSPAVNIPSRPSTTDDSQPNAHPTLSQRSSAEGRNLLNRKKRLGRNHFLYDVSPEADDSCSADDEANRSSVEYYESKYKSSYQQQQQQQQQQPQTCFVNTRGQTTTLKTPPIVPPLPIFDDFDFEEFLSSFENDDEQFPLFKDCREFLLNRSSNKQRSTQTPNSINTNNNTNHNNNNSKVNQHTTTTKDYNNTTNHFQFPSLASNKYSQPTHLLTPSSHRSRDESRPKSKESSPLSDRYEELKRVNTQSHAYMDDGMTTKRHADAEHKKREIFISIETEPNEHGRSPISPDSLRSMVGNPQTMVEVEVDGLDNKFSKISDDDEQLPPRHVAGPSHAGDMMMRCTPFNNNGNHLPNVQLNNAKNLIQRMQDDFRQMSEEVGANIRQAMTGLNAVGTNTSMLYGNEQVGMSAGIGGRGGGTYVPRNTNTTPPPSATSVGAVAPMYAASGDVSGDACGDSDDMSSLDGYPISSKSSRRGVGSKLSADSAYGSLSRQRSSELSTTPQRSAARSRPNTSSTTATTTATLPAMLPTDLQTQQHQLQQQQQQQQYHYQQQQQQLQQQQLPQQATQLYKYAPVNARPRRISASSSSDNSDASDCNMKYKQQQQQLFGGVGNKNHNSNNNNYMFATQHSSAGGNNNNNTTSNNNNNYDSPLSSPTTIERTARLTTNNTTNTTLPAEDAAATPTTAANNNNKGHYSSSSSLSSTNAAMSATKTAANKFKRNPLKLFKF